MLNFSSKQNILIGIGVLFFLSLAGSITLFERVDTKEVLVVQSPFGTIDVHSTPGIKWVGFGRTTVYNRESDYEFIETVTFADKGTATLYGSFRYQIPTTYDEVVKLHASYPSETRFESSLIGNTVDRAVYMSGPLMTSEESVSMRRNELLSYINDQATKGVFKTEVRSSKEIDPQSGKEVTITRNVIVYSDTLNLNPVIETMSDLSEFGVQLYKLTIDSIAYQDVLQKQFDKQVASSMEVQNSKVKAIQAEQAALEAEADGRRRVAVTNASKAVELAEAVANARKDSIQAAIQLTTATINAEKERVEAEAEAFANRQMVAAGLTPAQRAEYQMKTAIGIAEALAKRPVPGIITSGGTGSTDASEILILKMLEKSMK